MEALPMLPSSKVSLKLFIHKSTNRVLFAEAGKDFVDFFVNILRLPVGNLIAILKPDMMLGCLGNIHDSIINLSPAIWSRMHSGLNCHLSSGVKGAPYLVMDDLEVKPLSIASVITLLDEFHLKDGDLEEKVVDMGRMRFLLSRFQHFKVNNVFREARVADKLAKEVVLPLLICHIKKS